MAPISVTAVPPPAIPKAKRPLPAGVQTNGASSIRSTPSPLLTSRKPPVSGKASSAAPNGMTVTPVRPPKVMFGQANGVAARHDGQLNGTSHLSMGADQAALAAIMQRPYGMQQPGRLCIPHTAFLY